VKIDFGLDHGYKDKNCNNKLEVLGFDSRVKLGCICHISVGSQRSLRSRLSNENVAQSVIVIIMVVRIHPK